MMSSEKESRWKSPEFLLVVVMLLVLLVLVVLVLWAPIPGMSTDSDATMALDYRKSILSVIITAFGAWVGAGAAYYFGRENLREASRSLLAMREPSPEERLRRTPIREVPPRAIDWTVKTTDTLETVVKKLKDEPVRWFIPITENDTFKTIISEEAIWRFISDNVETGTKYDDLKKEEISKVLESLDKPDNKELKERSEGISVSASLDDSAAQINELMGKKNVKLAIITDDKGKPAHFITTADVRKVLLRAR